jgi:DNA topoisomerase-2
MREAIRSRSMWAGSQTSQLTECYTLDGDRFVAGSLKYPPALYKMIDEIVVNAIDHYTTFPKAVSEIKISVNAEGEISVYNNGPGIHVEKTHNTEGREMYSVELIFSQYLAGSNLDDTADTERIVGGQNGLGAKITAVLSEYFTVETVDSATHYYQEFKRGLEEVVPPVIKDKKKTQKEFTRITFKPDYVYFKLKLADFMPVLRQLMRNRAYQAAAYTGIKIEYAEGDEVEKIHIKKFVDFCRMFSDDDLYETRMTTPDGKYPWDICLGISDGKERQVSIVNGVFINSGGNHIKYVQNHLVENLRDRIEKELKKSKVRFNKNLLLNNLLICMRGAIPNPEFLSQTKDAISSSIEQFAAYSIPDREWNAIWQFVEPVVMATFLQKQLGTEKQRANRGRVDVAKYTEADNCRNSKLFEKCGLIITEGDSATGTAERGLVNSKSDYFNYSWFGIYGLQGVIVNALKESIEYGKKTAKTTKTTAAPTYGRRIPNKKLLENERIESLIKVLGLDFNKTYDRTEKGDAEWKTLRYGFVAGLVDQDLDGFNIFGLLCTFFLTYWPALLERKFIRRIFTPLIRAYPKKNKKTTPVKEFYSEKDLKKWADTLPEDAEKMYVFHYYKGLGSHDQREEVPRMFKNIEGKLCIYELDEESIKNMYIFYGEDTGPRKEALKTPVLGSSQVALRLPMSQQFETDTKLFQRDNIIRKLPNSYDGFVDCRRKVFYTAKKLNINHAKVQFMAGQTTSLANYHHGEASLEQSIVRMANVYPEGRNLPLLLPHGNFGSRSKGYKDYAAPRYIYVSYNKKLADYIFRPEDTYVLNYTMEESELHEPDNYAPIIPYVLCETHDLPATGWSITMHARDIAAVVSNVRRLITGEIKQCGPLPMCMDNMCGRIEVHKGRQYFVGDSVYSKEKNEVLIRGLPYGKWSYYYLEGSDADVISKRDTRKGGIRHKELVEDVADRTTLEKVEIYIKLKPGAMEIIEEKYGNECFSCIEDYLELYTPIYERINLVNDKGEVLEYSSYEKVLDDWFEYRKGIYDKRVSRERVLNALEIEMYEEIQRFSREHHSYNISTNTTVEQMVAILASRKYKKFNAELLASPKLHPTETLRDAITGNHDSVSYNYLLNMNYKKLGADAYQEREAHLKKLLDYKTVLYNDEIKVGSKKFKSSFLGAPIWMTELDEFEAALAEGRKSNWMYGEDGYVFEDTVIDGAENAEPVKVKKTVKRTKKTA